MLCCCGGALAADARSEMSFVRPMVSIGDEFDVGLDVIADVKIKNVAKVCKL
jgi:hypothetical protein